MTLATEWIQPLSRFSGTYTGARKRIRKTGVCISGPAWIVRKRKATPAAQPKPTSTSSSASPYIATMSTPSPVICIPVTSATPVTTVSVIAARVSATNAYPSAMPRRFSAASISRRANPLSKSNASVKPVNRPENIADCDITNTN